MNKARIVFLLSCLFLGSANASIINADNSSFLDTNTGLEWIDFGINDRYTYDFVSNQLGAGQRYSGWRLATEDEVVDLYFSYFYFQAEQQQSYLSGGNLNYISWAYNRNSGLGSVRSVFVKKMCPELEVATLSANSPNTFWRFSFSNCV